MRRSSSCSRRERTARRFPRRATPFRRHCGDGQRSRRPRLAPAPPGRATMTEEDRAHGDDRYTALEPPTVELVGLPTRFAPWADRFPTAGAALDLACGQGRAAVWLARRGLDVVGVDVSTVAIEQARDLAARAAVGDRCR